MQQITPFLLPGAIALAAILVFIKSLLDGTDKKRTQGETVSAEVITAFQTQVAQLKEMRIEDKASYDASVVNFTNEQNRMSGEIGRLNGVIQEKDKQIDKYEKIFQNRDPELLKVLQDIKTFISDMHEKMKAVDDRTKKSEERDHKIDQGHVAGLAA